MHPNTVIDFWRDAGPKRWFAKDLAFDERFSTRFISEHLSAARREMDDWAGEPNGSLALLILLDQFPRNAFRGTAHMFATDGLARHFARHMLATGQDQQVETLLRPFCYLPFEHSEDLDDQLLSVRLAQDLSESDRHWAREHLEIIRRFGRFPHRNEVLGRESTARERAFLEGGGFAG